VARARDLADVVTSFEAWAAAELPRLNAELTKRKLEPVRPLTRQEWEK
jgi:hypothetical protein